MYIECIQKRLCNRPGARAEVVMQHPVNSLGALAGCNEFAMVKTSAPPLRNKVQTTPNCRSSLLLGMAPVLLYVVGVATAVCAYQSAFQVHIPP